MFKVVVDPYLHTPFDSNLHGSVYEFVVVRRRRNHSLCFGINYMHMASPMRTTRPSCRVIDLVDLNYASSETNPTDKPRGGGGGGGEKPDHRHRQGGKDGDVR